MGGIAHYGWCWRESHAYLCMSITVYWIHILRSPCSMYTVYWSAILKLVPAQSMAWARWHTHVDDLLYLSPPAMQYTHMCTHMYVHTHAGLINWTASRDTNAQCDKHWSWCSAHITNRCSSAPTSLFSNDLPGLDTKGPVHCKTTEINPYPAIRYWPTLASSVTVPQLRLYNTLHTVWNDSSS